jgi:hypothetical protein
VTLKSWMRHVALESQVSTLTFKIMLFLQISSNYVILNKKNLLLCYFFKKKTCSLELEIAHFKLEEKNKGD